MQLIVITGRSGSGKSTALHQLEDDGYYAIDNLPLSLLPALLSEAAKGAFAGHRGVAVCIDARNLSGDLEHVDTVLAGLPASVDCRILYLDADAGSLLKRFSETRRRHPLSSGNVPLAEAIETETRLLEPLARAAALTLDTTHMTIYELRDTVRQRLAGSEAGELSVLVRSFGFKRGVPSDADLVFDVRMLPNPHWAPELRLLTGRDEAVRRFLEGHPITGQLFDDIAGFLDRWLPHYRQSSRSYITIAIGCTGGQHRSVYLAERLHEHLRGQMPQVSLRHRELP